MPKITSLVSHALNRRKSYIILLIITSIIAVVRFITPAHELLVRRYETENAVYVQRGISKTHGVRKKTPANADETLEKVYGTSVMCESPMTIIYGIHLYIGELQFANVNIYEMEYDYRIEDLER
jgi:hypothetical protein